MKEVTEIAKNKWHSLIQPNLPTIDLSKPGAIAWDTRMSDPYPVEWPSRKTGFVFYAYAFGRNSVRLKGAEYKGPAWGKLIVTSTDRGAPVFTMITRDLKAVGRVAVRPLLHNEIDILSHDPIQLIQFEPSEGRDRDLRAYYCLQKSIGNVPVEAIKDHEKFFAWLACGTQKH